MALPTRRRIFSLGSWRFQMPSRLQESIIFCATTVADMAMLVIGPILICFALVIAYCLTYTFFYVMLPMMSRSWRNSPYRQVVMACHITYVLFVLFNVLYNYYLCVMTSNKGRSYDRVVRELAEATGFPYPETPEEVAQCKQDFEDRMILRMERRRARREAAATAAATADAEQQTSNDTTTTTTTTSGSGTVTQRRTTPTTTTTTSSSNVTTLTPRGWMLMGPTEWAFCRYSNQPKPPRSHYDHVTKTLVLNMDHFCPWMFNTIGYLNYRYFVNFLLYVFLGMGYGAVLSCRSFLAMTFARQQVSEVWRPTRENETAIAFSFMLCLSIGLAVACLGGFHLFLLLTAQTTIEFHGNYSNKRQAKRRGTTWKNPYSLTVKQNWQQVYGTKHPLLALLPSSREPEFLPIPVSGKLIQRQPTSKKEDSSRDSPIGNSGIGIV